MRGLILSVLWLLAFISQADAQSYDRPHRRGMFVDPTSVPQTPDRAADLIGTDRWVATSLENRFAYLTFAAGMVLESQKAFSCIQQGNARTSFQARKKCLLEAGYTFGVQETGHCTISITERAPLQRGGPTTWDGKPLRPQIIGREVIIPLSLLREDKIGRVGPSFTLNFVNTPTAHVTEKILLASDPDNWVELPQPPAPDPDQQRFMAVWLKWSESRKVYGEDVSVDIFGTELMSNNEGSQLAVHYNFPSSEEVGLVQPFMDTVKEVLAKCVH